MTKANEIPVGKIDQKIHKIPKMKACPFLIILAALIVIFLIIAFAPAFSQEKQKPDTTMQVSIKMRFAIDTTKFYVMYVAEGGHVMVDSIIHVQSGYGHDMINGFFNDPHLKVQDFFFNGEEFKGKWILNSWRANR